MRLQTLLTFFSYLIFTFFFSSPKQIISYPVKIVLDDCHNSGYYLKKGVPSFDNKLDNLKKEISSTAACTITATISGNICVGSILSITSNTPIASVSWVLNGSTILSTQYSGLQNNGIVVAGDNGTGSGASQLASPNRIYVDKNGNIYIPDMANNRVQKWAPGATSGTTVAGGNGTGNQANQLNRPTSVAVDAQGNVYVADQNNSRVQKWAPGATTGITIGSGLNVPTDVFIDDQGNMYVSEQGRQTVLKFSGESLTGVIVAGGNGSGNAQNQLTSPTGIFVDPAGNIYICDTDNNRIQKWAPGATTGITVAQSSSLVNPLDIYVDANGNFYISDFTSGNVQKWAPGASSGTVIAGGNIGINPNPPVGIWIDSKNNLYVSDFGGGRVIMFPNVFTGNYTTLTTGTYTAKVVSTDGCEAISNPIVINEVQTPEITIVPDKTISCSLSPPTFTATALNAGPSPIYQWKINGVNAGSGNGNIFSDATIKNTDNVSCELTTNTNCFGINTITSNIVQVNLIPEVNPSVTIISNASTISAGTEVTFTAFSTNEGANPTYQWKVNDNAVGGNTVIFSSALLNDDDIVTCILTSNADCLLKNTATSNEIVINIPDPNQPSLPNTFTPNGDGINDTWNIPDLAAFPNCKVKIYNRYGQQIFESAGYPSPWKGDYMGSPCAYGVYMYVINLSEKKTISGTITIIK